MSQRESVVDEAGLAESGQRKWVSLVYLLFLLSGLTSLIYEIVWVRQFGLVFGVTTYAVSTVLAAFFAGLALGSYFAGRIIDRTRLHPLAVYGAIEGAIGIYALFLPVILRLLEATYPSVYSSLSENFSLFTLFRFILCFAVLVIPTTLMGATLPVLSKLMVEQEDLLGLSVGRLYAINTLGAVLGVASAGFLLIPELGVPKTTFVAALGNFFLAGAAIILSVSPAFQTVRPSFVTAQDEPPVPRSGSDRIILLLAFTSGLAMLALEVIWTRSLILILGSTTYAFSTMLMAVLVGIAAGSAVFAGFADSHRNRAAIVGGLFFAGGFCAVLGPGIINNLPSIFLRLSDLTQGVWSFRIIAQFSICFLLVFVPTFLSGASFPILVRMYSRGAKSVGRTVADIYAINTLGGILGSLLGGFVLIKFLGLQPALTVIALALMLIGGVLAMTLAKPWLRATRIGVAAIMIGLVIFLGFNHPRFDRKLLFAGWGPFAGGTEVVQYGGGSAQIVDIAEKYMMRLTYHKEGVCASVDVMETPYGEKIISINAQPVATTYLYDMRALKMLGHLPVLLHPQPKDVLIIGLGAGVSSGIIGSYPAVQNVTVAELSEEVPGGAEKFVDWNFDVLNNPKVRVVINDGANYVKATRKKYDIISSDPIHPFLMGNGILYSLEHWQNCKAHLREGGILEQWLPLYQLSQSDFATIIHTFYEVFPNATMWYTGIDVLLIGAKGDFKIDPNRMAEHMSDPKMQADLLSLGLSQPADVLGMFCAGPKEFKEIGGDAPLNRIEYPVLEFTAPKALDIGGVAATMTAVLTAVEQVPDLAFRMQLNALCSRPLDALALDNTLIARHMNQWIMRAQTLDSAGYDQQYLDAVRRAYALRPQDQFAKSALAEALCDMAYIQGLDGQAQESFASASEAFTLDPSRVDALAGAVQAALMSNDIKLAENTLRRAAPRQLETFELQSYLGQIALSHFDYELARQAFEKCAALDMESTTLHVSLGLIELKSGHKDAARKHFARALSMASSDDLNIVYDIVRGCISHNFPEEASAYAPQLVEAASAAIAGDPTRSSFYDYRAFAYTTLGMKEQAEYDQATSRSLQDWWQQATPVNSAKPAPAPAPPQTPKSPGESSEKFPVLPPIVP